MPQKGEKRPSRVSEGASEPLVLTIDEAAEWLRVSRSTIYHLLATGELVAVKIGRSTRIPTSSLERFIEKKTKASYDFRHRHPGRWS